MPDYAADDAATLMFFRCAMLISPLALLPALA